MAPQTRSKTAALGRFRLLDLPDHIVDQIVVTAVGSREEAMAIWPTCKAFLRPAMGVIWQEVGIGINSVDDSAKISFAHLLSCLGGEHTLGRYVRALEINAIRGQNDQPVDSDSFWRLIQACPNVRTMRIYDAFGLGQFLRDNEILAALQQLPVSSLFLIDPFANQVDLDVYARLLAALGPRLLELSLRVCLSDPPQPRSNLSPSTVFSLDRLRRLSIAQIITYARNLPQLDDLFRMIGTQLPQDLFGITVRNIAADELFATLLHRIRSTDAFNVLMQQPDIGHLAWDASTTRQLRFDRPPIKTARMIIEAHMLLSTPHQHLSDVTLLTVLIDSRDYIADAVQWLKSPDGSRAAVTQIIPELYRADGSRNEEDEGAVQCEIWNEVKIGASKQMFVFGSGRDSDLGTRACQNDDRSNAPGNFAPEAAAALDNRLRQLRQRE